LEDSLVDSHLPVVVGVGSVSARRHSGAEFEFLGWDSGDSGDYEVLLFLILLGDNLESSLNFLAEFL
jgi:hypothetical protein